MEQTTESLDWKMATTEVEGESVSLQQRKGLLMKLAPETSTLCARFDGPEAGATLNTSEEE
jgi:hypothetical protein